MRRFETCGNSGVSDQDRDESISCLVLALESIKIPHSVSTIEVGTFFGCSALKHVDIPESVTSIDTGAFQFCAALESIKIPTSVASIGADAFHGCGALKHAEIPESVDQDRDESILVLFCP